MNLVIDTGNTQTKLAVFNAHGKIVLKKVSKKISLAFLKKIFIDYKIQASIISSVAGSNNAAISFLEAHTRFILFTHKTKIPVINSYLTPKTLGRDRLANAIAACNKAGKYIGICGQGPSDHPDLARWLVDEGIDSISLNPDTVVETWMFLAGQSPA